MFRALQTLLTWATGARVNVNRLRKLQDANTLIWEVAQRRFLPRMNSGVSTLRIIMRRLFNLWRNDKGTNYIEFILTLPLQIGFLFAIVHFGMQAAIMHGLDVALQEGLRRAEIAGGVTAEVISAVQNTPQGFLIDPSKLIVQGTPGPVPFNGEIEVIVQYPFKQTFFTFDASPVSVDQILTRRGKTTSDLVIR